MHKFEKGNRASVGHGRPKKTHVNVKEILEKIQITHRDGRILNGFDPIYELALLGATAKSEKVRNEACSDLASFIAPKLKSMELTGDNEKPVNITLSFGQPELLK